MTSDRLKEIEDWPDYLISQNGKVFSKKRNRYLTPYLSRTGYFMVRFRSPAKSKCFLLSRLLLTVFVCPAPKGYEAAHLNGKPTDNRLENLKWCSRKENDSHKKIHGTDGSGERNSRAKLHWTDVILIKSSKENLKQLSERYGVCQTTISMIRNNLRWNVKNAPNWKPE